jgi:Rrf2 family protein
LRLRMKRAYQTDDIAHPFEPGLVLIDREDMLITQKKQYALRAVFELARQKDEGPLKTAQIAETQAIPIRFLEIILNHLKRAGLVDAKRGMYGGYQLTRAPEDISVADIFSALDGPSDPATCVSCLYQCDCPFYGECAFIPLWVEIQTTLDGIYRRTTIQNLLENQKSGKCSKIFAQGLLPDPKK